MHDAIVVGMGPAGSSAATELARAGLSGLGLEGKAMPRYKVCGGALSARTDRLLEPDYHSVVEETFTASASSSPAPRRSRSRLRSRWPTWSCATASTRTSAGRPGRPEP